MMTIFCPLFPGEDVPDAAEFEGQVGGGDSGGVTATPPAR